MKSKNQINLIKIAFVIILLIVPWSLNNYSEYNLVELNDENLQFYKSNTCKFSFISFYIENISYSNIEYNFDNLSTSGIPSYSTLLLLFIIIKRTFSRYVLIV